MRWLIAVVALAGCSDPYGADYPRRVCDPGHTAGEGGCTLPIADVTIDGDAADWSAIEPLPIETACVDPPCPALPTELRLARVAPPEELFQGALLLSIEGAPPPADPTTRWVVRFTETPELAVSTAVDELSLSAGVAAWWKNGLPVTFTDHDFARFTAWSLAPTPDGFEAEIAGDWLPYGEAALLTIAAEHEVDGAWITAATTAEIPACWSGRIWNPDPCGAPRQ